MNTEIVHTPDNENASRGRFFSKERLEQLFEYLVVITLSAIPAILFYTTRLKSVFDHLSIVLLLLCVFLSRDRMQRYIPRYVLVTFLLYALSFLISAAVSENKLYQFLELKSLRIPVLAALLFVMPFNTRNRKIIMAVYMAIAATLGFIALSQYYGILFPQSYRPIGVVEMPGIYAGMLSFACGSAAVMLFIQGNWPFRSPSERLYLLFILLSTATGILLFQSRSVWIAFIMALTITMFFYNKRTAVSFTLALVLVVSAIFSVSSSLRQRAVSIITSVYTENETGSTGNRLELWKAAWMIFARSPLFGTGLWDYQSDVNQLINENKIKKVPVTFHAHNIYLHNLATRGITGLLTTLLFFIALFLWGISLVGNKDGEGGYIIIFCTLIIIIGGITESTFADGAPYAFTYWYTVGLFGSGRNG